MKFVSSVCFAILLGTSTAGYASTGTEHTWNFSVLLDNKPIGNHRFVLDRSGSRAVVMSEADFDVKLLFVTVFSYEHHAQEIWDGSCLTEVDAKTNVNGKRTTVSGEREAGEFTLDVGNQERSLPGCVKTFAYWNPDILNADHLLNPQTGEYVPVDVQAAGKDTVLVKGRQVTADRYRIEGQSSGGEPIRIDLWYSPQHEWLGLDSIAQGGRHIRYRLE